MKRTALVFPGKTAHMELLPSSEEVSWMVKEIEGISGHDLADPANEAIADLKHLALSLGTVNHFLKNTNRIQSISYVVGFEIGEIAAMVFSGYVSLEEAVWLTLRKKYTEVTINQPKARLLSPTIGRLVQNKEDLRVIFSATQLTNVKPAAWIQWLTKRKVGLFMLVGVDMQFYDIIRTEHPEVQCFGMTTREAEKCFSYIKSSRQEYVSILSECMATIASTANLKSNDNRSSEIYEKCSILFKQGTIVDFQALDTINWLRASLVSKGLSSSEVDTVVHQVLLDVGIQCNR